MQRRFRVRAHAALAALVLPGCGLFLHSIDEPPLPEYIRHPVTAYQIEGEVRDEVTLAPMPNAAVTIETHRPGYAVTRRADAGGRFAIGYSTAYRLTSWADRLITGEERDAYLVSHVSIRAEAMGRCSPIHTFDLDRVPRTGFLLLVGDCDTYRPRH